MPDRQETAAQPMTLSVAHASEDSSPVRGLLPLWVGIGVYALFLLGGNRLLIDPDTMWQVTVGQWILDHRAVPETDVFSFTMRGQPWISTQWLAQVVFAKSYALFGWSGPVVLSAAAIAATFALFTKFLNRHLSESTTLVFVAAALALTVGHLFARPHVLAMPVMVAWACGLVAAADRREAPSFWLLPLMALWSNLHGGFVFGLVLIAPLALDAVVGAKASSRRALVLRWAAFGFAALVASCCNPYGWNALLAAQKILEPRQRAAADHGMAAGGFRQPRAARNLPAARDWVWRCGAASGCRRCASSCCWVSCTWRCRKAAPARSWRCWGRWCLRRRSPRRSAATRVCIRGRSPRRAARCFSLSRCSQMAGTFAYASVQRFEPHPHSAPVAAVVELKKLNVERVFNDYDFGGYLIASGVAPFIDGRTELYGEKFFVDHNAASGLMEPDNLFRLLDQYRIEATLMRTQSAATKLLDHVDGWQKFYADDIATIHIRKAGAIHTAEPAVEPKAK